MKKQHSPPIRNFKIYALYDWDSHVAFLAKSYAEDLRPLYSKHISGKNIYTEEYFGKEAPYVMPQLAVLESVKGTYRDAYRHVVAWTRVFQDAGFEMIMQSGIVYHAHALHPATKAVYDTIRAIPLHVALAKGQYKTFSASRKEAQPEVVVDHPKSTTQFNLRVFVEDVSSFVNFCDRNGLSRKEGFSLLLHSCPYNTEDAESYANNEILSLKRRLAAQTAALEDAQKKLAKLTAEVKSNPRYHSLLATTQSLLKEYCEIVALGPDVQPFMRIKPGRYRNSRDARHYAYPLEETGVQVIVLDSLLYGRGRYAAVFVLGHTLDKRPLKLRYYPKRGYVGFAIPRSQWCYEGAKWLVAWNRVPDGAVEICASLPIPSSTETMIPDDFPESYTERPTVALEDLISEANELLEGQ
ncbi:MAG: hypothetical protein J6K84_02325 [Oscillospiraceae bacterium]|nr:hypothetical protein [Oscillospiraceae bacterium]